MGTPDKPGSGCSDKQQFRLLVERHEPAVRAYALRRGARQLAEAEDVAADAFLVAWRRRSDIPAGAGERAWLLAVTRKVLANHQRALGRRKGLFEKLRTRQLDGSSPQVPFSAIGNEERVRTALEALRASDRELLRLKAWEDLSNPEIAMVLGVRESVVAVRLSRARERLKRALKKVGIED